MLTRYNPNHNHKHSLTKFRSKHSIPMFRKYTSYPDGYKVIKRRSGKGSNSTLIKEVHNGPNYKSLSKIFFKRHSNKHNNKHSKQPRLKFPFKSAMAEDE